RVPGPGSSAPGQSVPKSRPKGVDDGKQVNIPAPVEARYHPQGGRRREGGAGRWSSRSKGIGVSRREKAWIAETRWRRGSSGPRSPLEQTAEKSLGGEFFS